MYNLSSGKLTAVNINLSQYLKLAQVFSFEQIDTGYLVFGTVLKGLYITDLHGKIIHHINKQKGLLHNTVLSLHYSPKGKLWLGMDYGVATLNLNNDLTYFYDNRGDFGTGNVALLKNEIFYLGTNQGLYTSVWKDLNDDSEINRFNLLPGTEGQVWTLKNIDNILYMGHDKGLFEIEQNSVKKISDQQGVWTIIQYKEFLLTGNYNGISIFKKINNMWTFINKMELILGSCNQLIIEKNNILWVNIPNFGIIRADLDDNLYPENRIIFPDSLFNGNNPNLVISDNGIKVITDVKEYLYDSHEKKFIPKAEIKNKAVLEGLLPDNYQKQSLSSEYDFLPIYNGFVLKYLLKNKGENKLSYTLLFRKAEAFNNNEKTAISQNNVINYRLNNVRIECIVPNQDHALYQFKLKNSDKWSAWSSNNTFEFLSVSDGNYNVLVRANVDNQITDSISFPFKISAPWYRTWYSFLAYVLLVFLMIYLIRMWQEYSLRKQKKKLLKKEQNSLQQQAKKHKQEVLLLEKEQLKTEFSGLKQQLKSKTIELANKAKDNEDKNKLLLSLKEKLEEIKRYPAKYHTQLNDMERLLESYLDVEDKTFEIQIDQLHQEFFKTLIDRFPGLSNYDMRLCAYLKIGLNSKEIADLLNVQPSSAYISRSRLRKKLNLNIVEDLHSFLNAL